MARYRVSSPTAVPTRPAFFWGAAGLARELAGQTYRRENAEALGLIVAHGTDDGILMTFDQGPSFIGVQVGGCSVFVWATRSVLDVSRLHDDANTRAPLGYGRSDRCPFFFAEVRHRTHLAQSLHLQAYQENAEGRR